MSRIIKTNSFGVEIYEHMLKFKLNCCTFIMLFGHFDYSLEMNFFRNLCCLLQQTSVNLLRGQIHNCVQIIFASNEVTAGRIRQAMLTFPAAKTVVVHERRFVVNAEKCRLRGWGGFVYSPCLRPTAARDTKGNDRPLPANHEWIFDFAFQTQRRRSATNICLHVGSVRWMNIDVFVVSVERRN